MKLLFLRSRFQWSKDIGDLTEKDIGIKPIIIILIFYIFFVTLDVNSLVVLLYTLCVLGLHHLSFKIKLLILKI